jgi:predicted PurR-regulated permease PerM
MSPPPQQRNSGTAADAPARDPFVTRVATVLVLTLVTAAAAALLVLGIGVVMAAFAGLLVALVLAAPARLISRRTPLPYGWALGGVVLLLLAVLGVAGWLVGSQVAAQAEEFGAMLPQTLAAAEAWLEQRAWGQWILDRTRDGGGGDNGAMAAGMGLLAWLSDVSSYALAAVFVGLFLAANPGIYRSGVVGFTPPQHRDTMDELIGELTHTLRWWLVGQGIAMVVIGVSTMIVLFIFGVPLALVVGLIVGLLGFIPYIGPIVGLLPVAMVAATVDPMTLLYVLLAYTGVQLVEGYIITPLIHERTVYLPPAFTVFFQILLGMVLGIKGIILATPLAAVLLVLSRFYRRDFLGDEKAEVHE